MSLLKTSGLNDFVVQFNSRYADHTPFQLVGATAGATLALAFIYKQLTSKHPLHIRMKKQLFRLIRKIPMVKKKIEGEIGKVQDSLEAEHLSLTSHLDDILELPEHGLTEDEVLKLATVYTDLGDADWRNGSESGTVYNANAKLTELMTKVYGMTAWSNPLHPGTFPGIRKMEAEVVRMCCNMFNGGPDSCGCISTGGTESIILACKAYRDWAREERGIQDPNIIVPVTAHAAFDKAAAMLDMVIKHIAVDPETRAVDVKAMSRAIDSSTCMLAGSCPQFPHGTIDDIQAIAALGLKKGIPVHVDACLGGFLVPFMEEAGYPLPPFDFRVEGVTSISADTHKYGFAPKGSSVILYSEPKYRHYQWFTFSDWPGGIYATSTISGSKAGGITAACWASLVHHGRSGYVDSTRKIVKTTKYIAQELGLIKGIKIFGKPQVSVVAFGSDETNIFGISDTLKNKGWNLNNLQFPSCIHLCVTMLHTEAGVADKFIKDVREATETALANPDSATSEAAAIYGMSQTIPDRGLVNLITWSYLDSLYITKAEKEAKDKLAITQEEKKIA